jgi:hypothetical protein
VWVCDKTQVTKKANLKPVEVTAIESADKSGQNRKIDDWVKNIKQLHKNKPRPQVCLVGCSRVLSPHHMLCCAMVA